MGQRGDLGDAADAADSLQFAVASQRVGEGEQTATTHAADAVENHAIRRRREVVRADRQRMLAVHQRR